MHIYQKIFFFALMAFVLLMYGCTMRETPEDKETPTPTHTDAGSTQEIPELMLEPTPAPTPEQTAQPVRYELTDEEREIVERVVMAESMGEPYDGQRLVAQCILNTAEATGKRPDAVVMTPHQYAAPYDGEIFQSVKDAVAAVFDRGEMVTDRPVQYFYNPAKCVSKWHESLVFVIEVGGHRFFEVGS